MKISELIEELFCIRDKHGNISVVLHDSNCGEDYTKILAFVRVSNDNEPKECVIAFDRYSIDNGRTTVNRLIDDLTNLSSSQGDLDIFLHDLNYGEDIDGMSVMSMRAMTNIPTTNVPLASTATWTLGFLSRRPKHFHEKSSCFPRVFGFLKNLGVFAKIVVKADESKTFGFFAAVIRRIGLEISHAFLYATLGVIRRIGGLENAMD